MGNGGHSGGDVPGESQQRMGNDQDTQHEQVEMIALALLQMGEGIGDK